MAEDRNLDLALAALHGSVVSDETDDARFAKRIAAGLSNFAPVSRRDLDPVLAAPFPDDHHDVEEFAHDDGSGDDHHAAHAADAGDVRGWEGSMSDDERSAPNSLAGLSGLTRSGPTSRSKNDGIDGAAKGDDSGLIDLRAMSQPPADEAPAADAAPALNAERSAFNKTTPAVPSALGARSESKIAAAAAPAPAVAAAAVAAPAVAAASPKKKGAGLWIALGGLAAAAAVAAVVIPMSNKKSEETTASAPAAPQAPDRGADKDKKDEKVAAAPAPSAAPTAEQAPAAASASAQPDPEPATTVAAAPAGAAYGTGKPGAATPGGTKGMVEAPKTAPDPKQAAAAPSTDPVKKPGGGSLDDVLGLGKGNEPAQKKADPNENLPDRPDSMDVRSAINGKVGAARACVKGQDDASSVSVTFGPGGSVSGVAVVSGPAKGTGAETCIKNAFASAKVPPSRKGASGSAVLQP